MEGPGVLQSLINIHFTSDALSKHLLQRPAMLYFVFGSSGVLVLVAHDLKQGVGAHYLTSVLCFVSLHATRTVGPRITVAAAHNFRVLKAYFHGYLGAAAIVTELRRIAHVR